MLTRQTFWQLFRFGIVGVCAALVNYFLVVLIVEQAHWHPLVANIVAYLIAFNVSYLGHRFWSFGHKQHDHTSLPKFFSISVSGFLLNEGFFALLLRYTTLHYSEALIIAILMAALFTFTLSKFWVFK